MFHISESRCAGSSMKFWAEDSLSYRAVCGGSVEIYHCMGSSLNLGPLGGPFCKGAVLHWGSKEGVKFRELPT